MSKTAASVDADDTIPCGPPSDTEITWVGTMPPMHSDPNAPPGGVTIHADAFDLEAFVEDDEQ